MSHVTPEPNHKLQPVVTLAPVRNGKLASGDRYAEFKFTLGCFLFVFLT